MISTTHNLRLQAWLYLLFISGLLTGLLGFVGQVWPGLAIPESLMVTMRGSVVLILGSLVMLSLMLQSRPLRYLSGSLLTVVGGYYAVHQLLAAAGLVAPAAQASSEIAPMTCSLLWGLGGLIGTESRLRRLFAMLISCIGMAIGSGVLLMFLQRCLLQPPVPPADPLRAALSVHAHREPSPAGPLRQLPQTPRPDPGAGTAGGRPEGCLRPGLHPRPLVPPGQWQHAAHPGCRAACLPHAGHGLDRQLPGTDHRQWRRSAGSGGLWHPARAARPLRDTPGPLAL